jgi:hypothetical protein
LGGPKPSNSKFGVAPWPVLLHNFGFEATHATCPLYVIQNSCIRRRCLRPQEAEAMSSAILIGEDRGAGTTVEAGRLGFWS